MPACSWWRKRAIASLSVPSRLLRGFLHSMDTAVALRGSAVAGNVPSRDTAHSSSVAPGNLAATRTARSQRRSYPGVNDNFEDGSLVDPQR